MEINKDDWDDDFILKVSGKDLKRALVQKHLGKICNCKPRTILVDRKNRRLECSECGAPVDPFDFVDELCLKEHLHWQNIKAMREEKEILEKWMLNNRMGSSLREAAQNMRQDLVPCCPSCDKPFDLANPTHWKSKKYAIELQQQELLKKINNKNE